MTRRQLSERIEALALARRDELVEWVCEPDMVELTKAALKARLRMGTRDAVRNVLDLYGFLNDSPNVQIVLANMLVELGVRDDSELKSLVESGRRMEQIRNDATASLEDFRHQAVDLLKTVLQMHPEWRPGIVAELGSVVPVTNGGTK